MPDANVGADKEMLWIALVHSQRIVLYLHELLHGFVGWTLAWLPLLAGIAPHPRPFTGAANRDINGVAAGFSRINGNRRNWGPKFRDRRQIGFLPALGSTIKAVNGAIHGSGIEFGRTSKGEGAHRPRQLIGFPIAAGNGAPIGFILPG